MSKSDNESEDLDHIPMADEGGESLTESEKQSSQDEGGAGGGARSSQLLPNDTDDRSLSPIRISDPDATPSSQEHGGLGSGPTSFLLDSDLTPEEQEEKARLIAQVLELQNTLDDLSSRVDNVKEENLRLRSENQVLGQYIENLMAASSVFQPANEQPKSSRRK